MDRKLARFEWPSSRINKTTSRGKSPKWWSEIWRDRTVSVWASMVHASSRNAATLLDAGNPPQERETTTCMWKHVQGTVAIPLPNGKKVSCIGQSADECLPSVMQGRRCRFRDCTAVGVSELAIHNDRLRYSPPQYDGKVLY